MEKEALHTSVSLSRSTDLMGVEHLSDSVDSLWSSHIYDIYATLNGEAIGLELDVM